MRAAKVPCTKYTAFFDVAQVCRLNEVDKEERPDVDSVYMSVCQALTGSEQAAEAGQRLYVRSGNCCRPVTIELV